MNGHQESNGGKNITKDPKWEGKRGQDTSHMDVETGYAENS